MSAPRGEFSSKLGFLMAAAGSAVGLGNIWGFPTQVASNGGAAFLVVYLVLAFCLAYPALGAEAGHRGGGPSHGTQPRVLRQRRSRPRTRERFRLDHLRNYSADPSCAAA